MISRKIADFIVETKYENIPEEVIEKAKLCFLDFLGVTIRGSKTKSAIAVNSIIKKDYESTVIGHGNVTSLDASLTNGISAHSLDLDDGHRIAQLHPGACVIPAALSLCEAYNKTGKEFISALVVGYEIATSMGIFVNPEHRNKGFHSTGTCGTFGATAAACKSINLNKNEVINSLGLAGTQASGLLESDHAGTMGKHLHAGKAAQSGVLSALLAKNGFTGASTIIEGEEGFLSAMVNSEIAKKEIYLGKWHILNVYFKKYPICRHLHSTIDAVLDILNKNELNEEYIQKIIVNTYKIAAEHDNYHPQTKEAIKQSLPVSLAIAVKDKKLSIDNLKTNEEISKISSKIKIEYNKNMDELYPNKRSSEVIIQTSEQSYNNRVDLPKGEPENQFTKYELLNKFNELNPDIIIDILSIINNLENYNIKDLMIMINNKIK